MLTGQTARPLLSAVPLPAGRVTAIDRVARTLSLEPADLHAEAGVSLHGIEVGSSVSIVYEESDGRWMRWS